MIQIFYTVIFFILSCFARKLRTIGEEEEEEGRRCRCTQKGLWVAQASSEQQNSFLKDFTFQLIPCSRNGAILLLNSKDLFYCQYYSILENNPQLPPNERRIPI